MLDESANQAGAEEGRGIDRRRLLKGAVATGVGVVAWSTPSISAIGGTPVYAAACTAPASKYLLGEVRNTSCDCFDVNNTGASFKTAGYKPLTTNTCGDVYDPYPNKAYIAVVDASSIPADAYLDDYSSVSGTYQSVLNGQCDFANTPPSNQIAQDGECARGWEEGNNDPPDAFYPGVCAQGKPGEYCQVLVEVYSNGASCNAAPSKTYFGANLINENGGFIQLPGVFCQANGSIFFRIFLECSDNPECLTDPLTGLPGYPPQ